MKTESVIETADKIRTELHKTFDHTFQVTPSFDNVFINWVDGPQEEQLKLIVSKFKSYDWIQQGEENVFKAVGYMWNGELFLGPRYITLRREISKERCNYILDHKLTNQMIKPIIEEKDLADMEKLLFTAGEFSTSSSLSNIRSEQTMNVIQFPSLVGRLKKFIEGLSPEQKLKLSLIQHGVPEDLLLSFIIEKRLSESDMIIDRIFKEYAEHLYGGDY